MSGPEIPPESNLFSKRRRKAGAAHKKRPPRLQTPPSSPSTKNETQISLQNKRFSNNTKSRSRTKLKQAPLVPGYDADLKRDNNEQISYSTDELCMLKEQLRVTPFSEEQMPDGKPRQEKHSQTPDVFKKPETADEPPPTAGSGVKQSRSSLLSNLSAPSSERSAHVQSEIYNPGSAGADPFSTAWKADPYDDNDDDAYIEPASMSRLQAEISGSESGGEQWEAELLRRAGHRKGDMDDMMIKREMRLVRIAEDEGLLLGSSMKARKEIAQQIEALAERQAFAEQKIVRLEDVIKQEARIGGDVNSEIDDMQRKVSFYEELVQRISTVARTVGNRRDIVEKWIALVDEGLKEGIASVRIRLEGGTDKFGRRRDRRLKGIDELREDFLEWNGRLVAERTEAVRKLCEEQRLEEIADEMEKWRNAFPDEYDSSCADPAIGKLLGNVSMLLNNVSWICKLAERDRILKEATSAFGIQKFAAWIEGRWEPRLQESCGLVASIAHCISFAGPVAINCIQLSLAARLKLEVEACEALGDISIRQALKGAIRVAKRFRCDFDLIAAAEACQRICDGAELEEDVRWVSQFSQNPRFLGTIQPSKQSSRPENPI